MLALDYGDRPHELGEELSSLNRRRDTLREDKELTLILMLPAEEMSTVAEVAPDLWSIRSMVAVLSAPEDIEGELHLLAQWEQRCRDAFESRLNETPHARARYRHGVVTFAYRITSLPSPPTLRALLEVMTNTEGWTGWPPWWVPTSTTAPRVVAPGILECWMYSDEQMFSDPVHSDYWRASTDGSFYLLRGYDEDSAPDRVEPGRVLSRSLPIWRAGEALHHAATMAERLTSAHARVVFSTRWEGLHGRTITSWPEAGPSAPSRGAFELGSIRSSVVTNATEIEESLPDVVARLLRPLDDAALQERPRAFIEHHLGRMRSRAVG
ncbi:MAG: hypothetical protein H6712_07470 [Myxococcales bacterium]|nr:hypothetical protein [Myxococcales bacterium]MCB9713674.1 hypothetical protein [Myxococcales bacterium]